MNKKRNRNISSSEKSRMHKNKRKPQMNNTKKVKKKKLNKIKVIFVVLILLVFYHFYNITFNENESSIAEKISNINRPKISEETKKEFEKKTSELQLSNKAFSIYEMSSNKEIFSKNANETFSSASLAKLFTIEYANTILDKDSKIQVTKEALALTKKGSSVAGLVPGKYDLEDIYAAMLIPSGNDAAYSLAIYIADKLNPNLKTVDEKMKYFLEKINKYLQSKKYTNTVITDPSGFKETTYTTSKDLKQCVSKLLKLNWFKDIVKEKTYAMTFPDGKIITWNNTNDFMDKESKFFDPNVKGIKTGSIQGFYNLVVYYKIQEKEFLVINLKSKSDEYRYKDTQKVLSVIQNIKW